MKKYRFKPRFYKGKKRLQPAYMGKVFRRDRGVCAKCGMNTLHLKEAIEYVMARCDTAQRWVWWPLRFSQFLFALGAVAAGFKRRKQLFEVDHIVPRERGGGDELENLQTLCLACHPEKTKLQRRQLLPEFLKNPTGLIYRKDS